MAGMSEKDFTGRGIENECIVIDRSGNTPFSGDIAGMDILVITGAFRTVSPPSPVRPVMSWGATFKPDVTDRTPLMLAPDNGR